jgi:indole-3-glycerol phosphate synthase/phosphoribosylanthranilate isomerase
MYRKSKASNDSNNKVSANCCVTFILQSPVVFQVFLILSVLLGCSITGTVVAFTTPIPALAISRGGGGGSSSSNNNNKRHKNVISCRSHLPQQSTSRLFSTTDKDTDTNRNTADDKTNTKMRNSSDESGDGVVYPTYTDEQLHAALDGLLVGSTNPDFDGRHLYGYGDPNHQLSKLQSITATRILDYDRYLSDPTTPTETMLQQQYTDFCSQHGTVLNLRTVITNKAPTMALAAEFKRASPSKGNIAPSATFHAGEQGQKYASAGADIISVLTEPRYFLGSLHDMNQIRLQTSRKILTDDGKFMIDRPAILRKEFTTNTYQILEGLAYGADTILLIVAVLPQHLLKELIEYARSMNMEPLVEVHTDIELEVAIMAGAKVIGVNNRNLHTFQMDLQTTENMAARLLQSSSSTTAIDSGTVILDHTSVDVANSAKYTLCSLSGMSNAFDVNRYRQINVGMCLIGESLMRATDPKAAITGLCLNPQDWGNRSSTSTTNTRQSKIDGTRTAATGGAYTRGTKIVKICGITNPTDALVACQAGANLIGVIFVPNSKRCISSPEQGRAVVDTVRAFGERTQQEDLVKTISMNEQPDPLTQMIYNAQVLEDVARRRPLVVGVFQNQPPTYIAEMVKKCGLDLVQLHGTEGMEAATPSLCGGVPAIRVVDIETDPTTGKASSTAVPDILAALTKDPFAILLDTSIRGAKAGGGTGVAFDWTIAEQIQNAGLPVLIAGGLSPDNIQEAVMSTRPWGVDVSSGVEVAADTPGMKDHDKVRSFVSGAKMAAIEASKGF